MDAAAAAHVLLGEMEPTPSKTYVAGNLGDCILHERNRLVRSLKIP
jgi:hypothetical protein